MYPPAHPSSQIGQLVTAIDDIKRQLLYKAGMEELNRLAHEITVLNASINMLKEQVKDITQKLDAIERS